MKGGKQVKCASKYWHRQNNKHKFGKDINENSWSCCFRTYYFFSSCTKFRLPQIDDFHLKDLLLAFPH